MTKIFWLSLAILSVFSLCVQADDDDDTPKKTAARQTKAIFSAENRLSLDKTTQQAAGIKTVILKAVSYRAEFQSYGMAVSIEPLLTLQNQYLRTLAEQKAAQAKVNFSQTHLNRLNYLHKEQIISTHALQDQQLALQTDEATLTGSRYATQQIVNNVRLEWGNTLANWLVNFSSTFKALTQQQNTLLKITFPQHAGLQALKTIFVAPAGQREQAVVAHLISAAPQSDNFSQGRLYFYQTTAQQIKAGMRVNVWIPAQQAAQTGVIVPETALLWHLGQAFVFVKVAEQQFVRRAIPGFSKTAHGYFVSNVLNPGEEVVSNGAQMLLSEEFKGQIPDEDDD